MRTLSIICIDQEQMPLCEQIAEHLDCKGHDVEIQDVPECDAAGLPEGTACIIMVEDTENIDEDC